MPSPTYPVFNGDPTNGVSPRRPAITDVGGAEKLDHQAYPPDPITMLTAADENQQELLAVAVGSVMPVAIIQVTISGGTPSAALVVAPSTLLLNTDFSIMDNAAGDTTITCPTTKLPPSLGVCLPVIAQAADFRIAYVPVANGFRVTTHNSSGTLADCNFTLFWF